VADSLPGAFYFKGVDMNCLLCGQTLTDESKKLVLLNDLKSYQEPEVIREIIEMLLVIDENDPEKLHMISGYVKGMFDKIASKKLLNEKFGTVVPFNK
jgi:hypothetical protein